MRPTQTEIDDQIARLEEVKKTVVARSMFGDDNIAAIDAMIEVLQGDVTEDETYDLEESGDWSEHVAIHARDAVQWLEGDFEEPDLAEGWPLREG